MTMKAKAKATTRTWGFWIGLVVTVFGAIQTGLAFLQPILDPKTFGYLCFAVGVIAMTAKFIATKVESDLGCAARDHDGIDEAHE